MTPTQRSLKLLRAEGFEVGVVEKRVPYRNITQDLWGCMDIAAVHPTVGVLFVQVTSTGNMASRRKKLATNPVVGWLRDVYGAGVVELHGWGKFGARGKRKLWQCRREAL
ncbi:MAG: hypothetical protein ACR2RL_21665 [Gammaproteobacteria bacterium]